MRVFQELSINDLKKIFKRFPLYSQEDKKDPRVILELYIPKQDVYWLITEGSVQYDDFIMFGYCKITDGEVGYIGFNQLRYIEFGIKYKIHIIPIKLSTLKKKCLKDEY